MSELILEDNETHFTLTDKHQQLVNFCSGENKSLTELKEVVCHKTPWVVPAETCQKFSRHWNELMESSQTGWRAEILWRYQRCSKITSQRALRKRSTAQKQTDGLNSHDLHTDYMTLDAVEPHTSLSLSGRVCFASWGMFKSKSACPLE